MKLISDFPMRGILGIYLVYPETGETICHFKEKQVITLTAKQRVLQSVYATSLTPDPITTLAVGTGGCIDPAGLYPKPVNQTLSSLYTLFTTISTTYTVDNTVPAVTYLADMDQSTGNGQYINEAALYTLGGVMFNIKTFPAIPKTSEFNIHFQWAIEMP